MQIVVKAAAKQNRDPLDVIRQSVAETLGLGNRQAVVSKVFPGQSTGQRSRLYTVELPDNTPAQEVDRVVARLSDKDAFEYASIPAARRPL